MTQDKFTWTTTKAATLTQGDTTQNATSFYDLTFVSKYIYPGSSTIEIIFPTGYSFIADSSCQTTSSIGGIYAQDPATNCTFSSNIATFASYVNASNPEVSFNIKVINVKNAYTVPTDSITINIKNNSVAIETFTVEPTFNECDSASNCYDCSDDGTYANCLSCDQSTIYVAYDTIGLKCAETCPDKYTPGVDNICVELGEFTTLSVASSTNVVNTPKTLTISAVVTIDLPTTGYLELTIPANVETNATPTCSDGGSITYTCTYAVSTRILTVTGFVPLSNHSAGV